MNNNLSFHDIVYQFMNFMAAEGVPFEGHLEADTDSIQRFTVAGDKPKSNTGWYILHTDGIPAGEFGCWKRGVKKTWCAYSSDELTDAERIDISERRKADKLRREAATQMRQDEAADRAHMIWDAATDATVHPYLKRKGVAAYGLRVGRWTKVNEDTGEIWLDVPDALLVPVRDGKRLVNLQAIFPDKHAKIARDKDFIAGGKKGGCFFTIGKPEGDTDTILIGEGYSTCATAHAATGYATVVAFDAGNLPAVARYVRKKFPLATTVVISDNDQWTVEPVVNPGLHFATQAANECRAWVAVPEFSDLSTKPTDFNDLAQLQGSDEVARQINAAIKPDKATEIVDTTATLPAANDNEPHQVDYISPLIHVQENGKPLSTIENLHEICRRLRVTVRYNVIKKEIELLIPGQGFSLDNEANASLAWLMSSCARFKFPTDKLGDFLCYMADQNPFNPVANWITSKPWDGRPRLAELLATIKAEDEDTDPAVKAIKDAMITRWMLSAVAAAFRPTGVAAKGVLVLQGGQNAGKTSWFKALVPAHLGVIQDGVILRPDDRDSVKQVVSYWIVELGELDATFRKSDIAQLKAFISRDKDVLRRAYARLESNFARRTVFFASVNPRQFLHDPTGNSRYWTISCESINYRHTIDMQQVWAEIYETLYSQGESWHLDETEVALLNTHNQDFEVLDPIKERLQTRYDWGTQDTFWRWMTATDAMQEIGFDKPQTGDVNKCGQMLAKLNGGKTRKSNGRKLSLVPPLKGKYSADDY